MATGEFDIIYANALPAATNVTDNDMILIIQGGRPKRALPSTMKGRPGDPGLSVRENPWSEGRETFVPESRRYSSAEV